MFYIYLCPTNMIYRYLYFLNPIPNKIYHLIFFQYHYNCDLTYFQFLLTFYEDYQTHQYLVYSKSIQNCSIDLLQDIYPIGYCQKELHNTHGFQTN